MSHIPPEQVKEYAKSLQVEESSIEETLASEASTAAALARVLGSSKIAMTLLQDDTLPKTRPSPMVNLTEMMADLTVALFSNRNALNRIGPDGRIITSSHSALNAHKVKEVAHSAVYQRAIDQIETAIKRGDVDHELGLPIGTAQALLESHLSVNEHLDGLEKSGRLEPLGSKRKAIIPSRMNIRNSLVGCGLPHETAEKISTIVLRAP